MATMDATEHRPPPRDVPRSDPDAPRSFFAGRRVLVTGHTGFKGAWLSSWLGRLGARVTGLSLPAEDDASRALFQAPVGVSLAGDIRDFAFVAASFAAHAPEIVFHLAAQSLVGRSGEDPLGTVAVNVLGTAHVLEAARQTPSVRAFVNVTSDKCYANVDDGRPFREGDPLGGRDPYSAGKACAEILTAAWRESLVRDHRPAFATARAGNVIGGGDWAERRLVPDIARALESGADIRLRQPWATRPWQHVLDPLRGYLMLARALCEAPRDFAAPWNFGPAPGCAVPVRDLAARVVARWGRGRVIEAPESGPVPEAERLALDATKAAAKLGWRSRYALDAAVALTVEWYARVRDGGEDGAVVAMAQIDADEAATAAGPADAEAGR